MYEITVGYEALRSLLVHPEGVVIQRSIIIDLLEPMSSIKPLLAQLNIPDIKIEAFLVRWQLGMLQNCSTDINDFVDEISCNINDSFESILKELQELTQHEGGNSSEEEEREMELMRVADEVIQSFYSYIFDTLRQLGVIQYGNPIHSQLRFFADYHPNRNYGIIYVLSLKPGYSWDLVHTGMPL